MRGTYGEKYREIIEAEEKLCSELGVDLITLDSFLWWVWKEKLSPTPTKEESESEQVPLEAERELRVPLEAERELREYLSLHPEAIERGLSVLNTEYQTGVGRIDLLCRDESGNFVVVELKKGIADERALGQLLRYMGWVREKMAGEKEVKGILVTHESDENLNYAVKEVANKVKLKYYAIKFELSDTPLIKSSERNA